MPDHASAITALRALGPLRVWSLLVTVFGDLAPDGPLDGPAISALMDGIGIKPEATRVALHRLRADGWITSEKKGRISQHRLTEKGQSDSKEARRRIYAHPETQESAPKVILTPDSTATLDATDFAAITPRLYMCSNDTLAPAGAMILGVEVIPDWIGKRIESPTLQHGYQALFGVLEQIEVDIAASGKPLDVAMLRVMIVHAWRRLVLKHPALPRAAHSAEWREHDCRVLVTTLLERLERPEQDQITAP